MSKYSPGPWRYWACKVDSRENPPMYEYAQFANPAGHVFRAPLRYLTEADARLIAAAPMLLEALQRVNAWSETLWPGEQDQPSSIAAQVRAAIAAATGEQQ